MSDRLTINQQVGRVLRAKRNLLGLVRHELAEELAVSTSLITSIELGKRTASVEFMQDFDTFFKMAHDRARIFPLGSMGDYIAKPELTNEETAFISILLIATPLEDMEAFIKDQEDALTENNEEVKK